MRVLELDKEPGHENCGAEESTSEAVGDKVELRQPCREGNGDTKGVEQSCQGKCGRS